MMIKNSEEKEEEMTLEALTLNPSALTLELNHNYESQMLAPDMCGFTSGLLGKYSK